MKSIVITGGSKGIGLSITKAFLNAGYYVVIGSRNGIEINDEIKNNFSSIKMDASNVYGHEILVNEAIKKTGQLDAYINNAGFSEWRPINKIDNNFLDNIFKVNLYSAFWGCQVASKNFGNNGGVIINISSIAGKRGSTNNSAYSATKFGMNALTQSLAKELGNKKIRINSLCPVLIDTEGLNEALKSEYSPAAGDSKEFFSNFIKNQSALNRLPSSKEVADMCVFLASDSATAVTGQCINVDCGVFPQ
ncbi:MAG: 4-formylbenzenesulfonate dehydrogenase TsaC1/TsaC2 [Alphaproteobacteria bacterium MarineAlpha5_Bin11]|nr:short-chain dehydrogenase [Pelagibacteraceae bacterium]PPR44957.1 MAG: 4-formylbenzenesulfonate dehydrogenase TsaC1/TsaC2 [Alphaproteobacteria bacterium MarineAlpha5_Bin11]|tara:strand:+ start:511 stop:1257 length:747 start_codon:yes stop_codon:yes gene_type:complete